ncbi:hypothetical protein ACOMHN_060482 [Nucella lapillus]
MPSVDKPYPHSGTAEPRKRASQGGGWGSTLEPSVGQSGRAGGGGGNVNSRSFLDNNRSFVDPSVQFGKRVGVSSSHDDVDSSSSSYLPPPPPELRGEQPEVPQRSTSLLASLSSSASASACLGDSNSNFPPFPPPPPPLSSHDICALSSQSLHRRPCRLPPYPKRETPGGVNRNVAGTRGGCSGGGTWPNKNKEVKDCSQLGTKIDSSSRPSDGSTLRTCGDSALPLPGWPAVKASDARSMMDGKQEASGKEPEPAYSNDATPASSLQKSSKAGGSTVGKKARQAGTDSSVYINGTDSGRPKCVDGDPCSGPDIPPPPVSENANSKIPSSKQGENQSGQTSDNLVNCAQQNVPSVDCEAYVNQHGVNPGYGCDGTEYARPVDTLYTNEDAAARPGPKTKPKPDSPAKKPNCYRTLPKENAGGIRKELEACLNKRNCHTIGRVPPPTSSIQDPPTSPSGGSLRSSRFRTTPGGGSLPPTPTRQAGGPSSHFTPYINSEESATLCRAKTKQPVNDAQPDPAHTQSAPYLNAEEAAYLTGDRWGGDAAAAAAAAAPGSCGAGVNPSSSPSIVGGDFPYVNKESAPYLDKNPPNATPGCESSAPTAKQPNNLHGDLPFRDNTSGISSLENNDKGISDTYVNDTPGMCSSLNNAVSAPPMDSAPKEACMMNPYINNSKEAAVAECRMANGKDWEGWRTQTCSDLGCAGSVPAGGMQTEQQHLLEGMDSPSPYPCCAKQGDFIDSTGVVHHPLNRQRSTFSTRSSSSRRRQNDSPCTTCLRGTLHCYNVCILIIGCAVLGVGVWLLVTDFGARNVTTIVGNQMYEVTTYLLIAGGGAVALLAFCGCCGTIREDKCVLSFYGTTLAIVLIVLGVACGLAVFFKGTISDHIKNRMKNTLTMHYGVDIRTNLENRRITESWDALQRQLQCCGISGNTTSRNSWSYYSSSTEWNIREQKKKDRKRVPESCCAKGDMQLCTGLKQFSGPPMFFDNHLPKYREVNPYLYTTGCYDKLVDYLHTYSTIVSIVAAVVPLFLILGIVVSFCLCARVAGLSDDEMDV